jgi:type IV pilus assembly protein PilV
MAEHDLYEWLQLLNNTLPSGDGHVCSDSTPKDGTPSSPACDGGGPVAIKVWWYAKPEQNTQRYVLSFEPG